MQSIIGQASGFVAASPAFIPRAGELITLCLVGLVAGCGTATQPVALPDLDACAFEQKVYPVLMRDCAFVGCHGSPERFFRVFGPGRQRIDPNVPLFAEGSQLPTREELVASYERSRSMVVGFDPPTESWFLRKPLDGSAGGSSHMGADNFGRNVYQSKDDPNWRLLRDWVLGELPCEQ